MKRAFLLAFREIDVSLEREKPPISGLEVSLSLEGLLKVLSEVLPCIL